MLNSRTVRIIWRSLGWLTRLTVIVFAAFAVTIALAIILLRYWLLPDIEQFHDRLTASFSEAIGNTVTVGKIEGNWEGLQPRLNFTDVRILDEQRQPVLVLPRIDTSVSWMSILTAELRLASLEIDRPELLIRRDSQGKLFLGDVVLTKQGGGHDLADWLLHQSRIAVRDALFVWVDEQRDAPPLVLQNVNLRIDSLFNQHRFALRALPPAELATPLDIRGDLRGASFEDLGLWHGQIFSQLDYTDATVWRPWLDLPREIGKGQGALRAWFHVEKGKVAGVTADLVLQNVVAKLAADAPEMALTDLRGRASWKEVAGGFEVSTSKLAMRMQDGTELRPTDFYLRTTAALDDRPAAGEVRANMLQLEKLAAIAGYLPLEPEARARLQAYSPSGQVINLDLQWQGKLEKPVSYRIKGIFQEIGVRQVGAMPGFSGLSLDVDGSETSGRLNINAHKLVVDAPGVMREPLPFDLVIGQAAWQREHDELKITLGNASVANNDLSGNVYGSYRTQAGTRGILDLTASLTRGDIRRAARYTPLIALDREGNDWLNGALKAGHTEDFRIRIKGNLSDFPLTGTKDVLFQIGGHVRDGVLEFARDWPRIENISGEFRIDGNKLEVISPTATMAGARLQNVVVALPDMTSKDLALEINGEAAATNDTFLQFVQKSPVRGYIDGFTDGARASGSGHLNLYAHIPLMGSEKVKVSGILRVQDSDIDLGEGVPWLRKTRGELSFTESGMQASGISAVILGGAASIDVQTTGGSTVHAVVQGQSNLDVLRKTSPHPLLNYLHGATAYKVDISVANKNAQIVINSDLVGISSTMPQPFAKRANEPMNLRIEKKSVPVSLEGKAESGQDLITAQLGNLLNARLERRDNNGAMEIKSGRINLGDPSRLADLPKPKKTPARSRLHAKTPPGKEGILLAGSLPELSIQGWGDLISAAKPGAALPLAGIDLHVEKLTGYGQITRSLRIDAVKRGDGLAARLASDTLNGEVSWLPHGYQNGGKFSARLRNLHWVKDEQAGDKEKAAQLPPSARSGTSAPSEKTAQTAKLRPDKLPAMEIVIDNLRVKDRQFGRFEMVGHPDGKDWRLRRLNITNPDGSLAGDGVWHFVQDNVQTQVNLQLKLNDVGKTLARYGYPNTVSEGSGKLAANLSWADTPDAFSYASLNGTLNLDAGKGRFLKMDPGAGKLLSILSLQALPSHIALDFNDVFRKGFQFDAIKGNASIKDGVINTDDFHVDGSAAKVTLKGNVDLNNGTQDLRVRVMPTIGDSVSLISAFAAGPAVGVGTLIVNKVLGNPLDKLVSFEYNVSGTWSEPNVVRIVKEPPPAPNE